jgi:hypothetical protein
VPGARIAAVVRFGRRVAGRVVRRVAVGEAVGHDEVDHVVGRDALKVFGTVERLVDAEGEGRAARGGRERQLVVAGPGLGADAQVDEHVGAGGVHRLPEELERRARLGEHAHVMKTLAADEQADGVDRVAGPP